MSKRPWSSSSSPSKRTKPNNAQSSLDSFFTSTRSATPAHTGKKTSFPKTPPSDIIDVDLLESDGEPSKITSPPPRVPPSESPGSSRPASKTIGLSDSVPSRKEPSYNILLLDPVTSASNLSAYMEADASHSVPFSLLAKTLAEISKTRSRISIINGLTNFFRLVNLQHPPSIVPAVYLLSNTISPPYISLELGLGPSAISQSIQHVSGLTATALRKLYNKHGDPGDVAFEAKVNMRTLVPHPALTIAGVHGSLLKISKCSGPGAAKQRQRFVEKLLVAAKGEETRFLVRILSQNLRVGAVRTSILTALARAVVLMPPTKPKALSQEEMEWFASSVLLRDLRKGNNDEARGQLQTKFRRAENLLRRMYSIHPNYEHIITSLLDQGFVGLEESAALTVGVPLHPTLGTPARSLEEVYERFGDLPFSAEFKYDGQRAQIHIQKDGSNIDVKIFSRHLEEMTTKYPDVVGTMVHMFTSTNLQSAILDAEIVAIDAQTGDMRSFQELSSRARKDVNLEDIDVPVSIFVFDLMYLNGLILLDQDMRARRSLILTHFPPTERSSKHLAAFEHVKHCDSTEGSAQVEAFWQLAVKSQSEGLMVKLLDSGGVSTESTSGDSNMPALSTSKSRKKLSAAYNVDQRTYSWIKLKKDYVEGIGDTLDLIPIGAWHGNGRKVQWWSPILLGIWDPAIEKPVAVCKCMSGFSDTFYKDITARYNLDNPDNCSVRPLWDCEFGEFRPSVYFKPQEVWELRGADITLSPVSIAAQGLISGSNKGLSVRFPRFLKLRSDKDIAEASTSSFLAQMYRDQPSASGKAGGNDEGDLEDPDPNSDVDDHTDAESEII